MRCSRIKPVRCVILDVLGVSQLPHIFLCRRNVLLRRSFYFLAELRSSRRCRGDSLFQMIEIIIHCRVRPRHSLLAYSTKLVVASCLFVGYGFLRSKNCYVQSKARELVSLDYEDIARNVYPLWSDLFRALGDAVRSAVLFPFPD